ncbi:trypsin-like peptidase domain-containing protein [Rhizobium sp. F40D2]|uniref:S1C family serine protease n=1 Tax=Rhizobium sp. F40D2 TaxID=3453141 RepID=UPI003F21A18D
MEVALADGPHYEAELVGTDVETDVAVLQIPPTTLIQAKFGTASSLEVGDVVVAIGNPFGLAQTATMGIVSALGSRRPGNARLRELYSDGCFDQSRQFRRCPCE